jgi:hypothetical protein
MDMSGSGGRRDREGDLDTQRSRLGRGPRYPAFQTHSVHGCEDVKDSVHGVKDTPCPPSSVLCPCPPSPPCPCVFVSVSVSVSNLSLLSISCIILLDSDINFYNTFYVVLTLSEIQHVLLTSISSSPSISSGEQETI